MKADTLQLLGDLIAINKVLFRIPVYQRNYDWSEKHCIRLLDDIEDIMETGKKHFLGTIVYMDIESNDSVLHDYVVIDGQQRLTTMMIILKALYDLAKEQQKDDIMSDINDYLQNRNCKEEYKIKLKPIETDNKQFVSLLNDDSSTNKEGNIFKNYETCKKRMESWLNRRIDLKQISDALTKLEIVSIKLKHNEDDPQIIFESLNSTGLELSNADLIRNFLLMNAAEQDRLFKEYWHPIEQDLKKSANYSDLNLFFSTYVVFKTNNVVNEKALYQTFVKLFKDEDFTNESCLKELKYFAKIFKAFIFPKQSDYSSKAKRYLQNLKLLKQTTYFPFLLHIFNDYHNGIIDQITLEKTLQFILTYLLRRAICEMSTNSLRGFFASLYNRIFRVSENKNKYYEAINKFLSSIKSAEDVVMPSEEECRNALITMNLYRKRSLCRFIMIEIENGGQKEAIKDEDLTIEHIMPQTLTAEWEKYISESEYETYLHTLGNLTLTGNNSELSNNNFQEKKSIICKSKAVILNQDILNKDSWTTENIKNRAARLANILLNKYKVEKIDDPSIKFEHTIKVTLDNVDEVLHKKLISFTFKGMSYTPEKYSHMLVDVIKLLDREKPDKLQELADKAFHFENSKHALISNNSNNLSRQTEIRDGIFVECNLTSKYFLVFIKMLMKEYGVDESQFYVSVTATESDE